MTYNVLDNSKFRFSKDGTEIDKILGMDMQAKMPIVYRAGEYLVFKRNGFTGWAGVGWRNYYHPHYYLVEIAVIADSPNHRIVKVIEEIEAGARTWRSIVKKLKERADRLETREKKNPALIKERGLSEKLNK